MPILGFRMTDFSLASQLHHAGPMFGQMACLKTNNTQRKSLTKGALNA